MRFSQCIHKQCDVGKMVKEVANIGNLTLMIKLPFLKYIERDSSMEIIIIAGQSYFSFTLPVDTILLCLLIQFYSAC